MPNVQMTDYGAELYERYADLFETGKRRGIEEVKSEQLHQLLKRYSGGFGRFSYAIMDFSSGEIIYAADDIDQITGYPAELYEEEGLHFFLRVFPREHHEAHFKVSEVGWTFANSLPDDKLLFSTANFDHINRNRNGNLLRVLTRQIAVRLDSDGKIWLTLAIFTDISHIKEPDIKDGPRLSYYIPATGEFLIYNPTTGSMINLNVLTDREREIMRHYSMNKSAGAIAEELYLSPNTVQTHRANILTKTGCKNLAELTYFSRYHLVSDS